MCVFVVLAGVALAELEALVAGLVLEPVVELDGEERARRDGNECGYMVGMEMREFMERTT